MHAGQSIIAKSAQTQLGRPTNGRRTANNPQTNPQTTPINPQTPPNNPKRTPKGPSIDWQLNKVVFLQADGWEDRTPLCFERPTWLASVSKGAPLKGLLLSVVGLFFLVCLGVVGGVYGPFTPFKPTHSGPDSTRTFPRTVRRSSQSMGYRSAIVRL